MKYSRRRLLQLGPAALAAATLPKAVAADWNTNALVLRQETFAPLVNSAFRAQSDSGVNRWFTLLAVEDPTPQPASYQPPIMMPRNLKIPASRSVESFALVFRSPGDPLPQKTYVFEHDAIGRVPLFIVPLGDNYVAIINRIAVERGPEKFAR